MVDYWQPSSWDIGQKLSIELLRPGQFSAPSPRRFRLCCTSIIILVRIYVPISRWGTQPALFAAATHDALDGQKERGSESFAFTGPSAAKVVVLLLSVTAPRAQRRIYCFEQRLVERGWGKLDAFMAPVGRKFNRVFLTPNRCYVPRADEWSFISGSRSGRGSVISWWIFLIALVGVKFTSSQSKSESRFR